MPFVKRHRTYYKYGTEPNASIVGSFARIDKGVASGFSSANYLTLPEVFNPQSNTWEQVWSVTTGANTSTTYQEILAQSNVGTAAVSGYDLRVDAGKIILYVEGTAFTGATVLQDNTRYLIKAQYTGSAYILSYSTDNGASWVEDCNVASTVTGVPDMNVPQYVGVWKSTYNSTPDKAWLGSIELTQSYININGSRWWSGDTYNKVGSWIDNGVVSGFGTSNYLVLPKNFDVTGGKTWEMMFKVTTGSDLSKYSNITGTNYYRYDPVNILVKDSKFLLDFCSGTSTTIFTATGTYTVLPNTVYWIKMVFNGSTYTLDYSLDGSDFVNDITVSNSTSVYSQPLAIGVDCSSTDGNITNPWRGSIDLNQSYIKINNKDWWHGTKAYQINVSDKDVYEDWKQPVLTNYGTMGGISFAVAESSTLDSGEEVWRLFASSPTYWHSAANLPQWISWYNPNPLKVTKLSFTSATGNHRNIQDFIVQACDDNSSWIDILSYSNANATGDFEVDLSSNDKAYKYWRIYITSSHYANVSYYAVIYGLKITAQKLMATGTIEEADYYVNHNKLYQLAAVKRSYWKYDYQDWTQPVLTSDTSSSKISLSSTGTYSGNDMYKAFDSDEGSGWLSTDGSGKGSLYVSFPNVLKISSITVKGWSNPNGYTKTITIYKDKDNTEVVGDTHTYNGNGTYTWVFNEPILTDFLSFYSVGSGKWGCIGNIKIDAQEEIVVAGTSTDYVYYTDKLLSYAPIVRGKRSYYKQDLKQRDTGTYTFTLDKDYTAKMLFVGNGGGGCTSQKDSRWHYSSGGSGACFEGLVRLPADTYTLTIGSLGYGNNANNTHYHSSSVVSTDSFLTNSAGEELIRVGAGGNGYTSVGGVGGAAGVLTLGTLDVLETKKATDGVYTAGNVSAGTVSAYDGTYSGYGAGTCGQRGAGNVYGIKGIFDLALETDINDFDWYEDVGTKIY